MNPFGRGALLGDNLLLNPRHRDLVLTSIGLKTSISYSFKEYEYICLWQ